ncbi:MAG: hypothetical protein ACREJ2_03600, partial [Planctomycetota bacterium]
GQGQGQGQGQAEAGPAPLFPSTPVARVVYVCPMDSYIATKPGVCPICHEPLVPMALGNADPRRGEATGAVIEHPIYAMVDGKPYAFASAQGLQQMLKHPLDYLHAAEDRARLEQDLTAVAWRRTRAG